MASLICCCGAADATAVASASAARIASEALRIMLLESSLGAPLV